MQHKNAQKPRRKYNASFKQDVISMLASGRPVPEIARSISIGESILYRCRKKAVDSLEDARTEIFKFIEMYYNAGRKHSSLHYQSPIAYENHFFYSLT